MVTVLLPVIWHSGIFNTDPCINHFLIYSTASLFVLEVYCLRDLEMCAEIVNVWLCNYPTFSPGSLNVCIEVFIVKFWCL